MEIVLVFYTKPVIPTLFFQVPQKTDVISQRHSNVDRSTDNVAHSQNIFHSFTPLIGNSAPIGYSKPFPYPEHSFKPSYKVANYRELAFTGVNDNTLGSGNFGVLKGGTYYAEEQEDDDFVSDSLPYFYPSLSESNGDSLYHHKNPPPALHSGSDFFAHFRDFADLTDPSTSSSHYYVVYVNKNTTTEESINGATSIKKPKNIIEQLTMLDNETADVKPLPANKSDHLKFKRKLTVHEKHNRQKDINAKSKVHSFVKEIPEPLLALS